MTEDFENKNQINEHIEVPVITPDLDIYVYNDQVFIKCKVKTTLDVDNNTHLGFCTLGVDGKPNYNESGLISREPTRDLPGLHRFFIEGRKMEHSKYFANFDYDETQ